MKSDTDTPTNAPTVMALAAVWQANVTRHVVGTPPKHLTAKQLGQLNRLRNLLAEESANVIRWTVEHWIMFARLVEIEAALSSSPAQPHIGFLVAHHATAVNLTAKKVPEQVAKVMAQAARERDEAMRRLQEEKGDTTPSGCGN